VVESLKKTAWVTSFPVPELLTGVPTADRARSNGSPVSFQGQSAGPVRIRGNYEIAHLFRVGSSLRSAVVGSQCLC
jgi:hypothetical protein